MIRLDHFRGFAAAWHVPAGAVSARSGEWVPGPGAELFAAVATELGRLPFIAEDLGLITDDVGRCATASTCQECACSSLLSTAKVTIRTYPVILCPTV